MRDQDTTHVRPVAGRNGGPGGAGPGRRPGRTISRYLLRLAARPFGATLLIVLPALLLERLLRLFDLLATANVPASSVARMLLDLVPHYLGLALPAALFIGIYSVVSRLSAEHELDAMQNAGFSLLWISRPFLLMGVVMAVLGFGLYDYLQPFARYAYRTAALAATQGGWNGAAPAGELVKLGNGVQAIADRSNRVTGELRGVMLIEHLPDGTERVTTARSGMLLPSADGTRMELVLHQAIRLDRSAEGRASTARGDTASGARAMTVVIPGLRARGADEREMTLGELRHELAHPASKLDRRRVLGELHGRLVRSLSLMLLPLLAVPFGLSAQRSGRQLGLVAGVVILVVYYHGLQLAQSFGTQGRLDPRPFLWSLFALFAVGSIHSFRVAARRMADSPVDHLLDALSSGTGRLLGGWRPRGRWPAAQRLAAPARRLAGRAMRGPS
ncbi:LptF/LptG family permease [Rhizosaccharibacter radicis]|uniref:LptF/LptG family permease n=1 Tax=Rhizosaccharibacter radicis TaxID=2782605 RepID=A0ABT1VV18_9PROT|nr:LptF/LptG family permease [Acetobacteraceae bacterium KSS12]